MADERNEQLRERLAAIEHQRWASWQRWMHDQCRPLRDGSLVIPGGLVQRWERQIVTPWEQLSEAERRSDVEQVDRYWPIIADALNQARGLAGAAAERAAALEEEVGRLREEVRRLRKFAHHHVVCLRFQRRFRSWSSTSQELLDELCALLGGYSQDGRRIGKGRGGRERKQERAALGREGGDG